MTIERDWPAPAEPADLPEPAEQAQALDGPEFFDHVFARFEELRRGADAPTRTIELPPVLEAIGDPTGRRVLDLGCGDAWLGRHLLERGAASYLGLDGSRRMVEAARQTLDGTRGEVRLQNLESWSGSDGKFDLIVSRLVFQFIRDLSRLFELIRHHSRAGSQLVFSIEHPVITSSYDGEFAGGIARRWHVGGYFREGPRPDHWLGAIVEKQHRPLERYFTELLRCGFRLEHFSEGRPERDRFSDPTQADARLDVPLCAIFDCTRDG